VYGYDEEEIQKVAHKFRRAGYPDVLVYEHFLEEWVPDPGLSLQYLERYRQLVPAVWIRELIDTGKAPEYDNSRYVIGHAHYRNRPDYEKGHIPGAVDLDTNILESSETWNRRSPEELEEALKNRGITSDTTVILYGRFSHPEKEDPFPGSSAGHLAAFRCAFIMLYAGVKDVRILNGGLQAWEDAGYGITRKAAGIRPVNAFGADIPAVPRIATDISGAKAILKDPGSNLVSVRSWSEFTGEESGYNYIRKKGRIPGAVFGACGSDAYHMENYRNLDHTTREYHEIEEMWAASGIVPGRHNAFYCGTGWRGSEAFFNAWFMGWPDISLYDGGWFEWSADDANPFEKGLPARKAAPKKV
jgi:thiosulfate/3-mercaptopyruvate sulfurtransferase